MSGFVIKLIALVTMVVDHTGAALFPGVMWLRMVGRIAFPLYIFLVAEGCEHTRSMGKYALRLGVFALVSELPFDVALYMRGGWETLAPWAHQNVFFTILLAVLAVWAYKELRRVGVPLIVAALAVVPCAAAGELGNVDYGWLGVAAIFLCALLPGKWWRMGAVAAFIVAQYYDQLPYLGCAMLALAPIALYNGERGPRMKWSFYAAYPVHLGVLALLRHLILPMF